MRLRRQGRRLRVGVRVVEGQGQVRVLVRQRHRSAAVKRRRTGNLVRARVFLRHRGPWKVVVRFDGAAGWADRRLGPRLVRVGRRR